MKFFCSSCKRLVKPGAVSVEESFIALECPKCGETERLTYNEDQPSEARPPGEDRDLTEETARCPKCDGPRGEEEACPSCGLIYELWNPDRGEALPEIVTQTWRDLGKNWNDHSLHKAFLQTCLENDALAFAARSYSKRRDEISKKQTEKLTVLGVQAMQLAEAPWRLNPRTIRIVGWAFFIVLSLVLSLMLITLAFPAR